MAQKATYLTPDGLTKFQAEIDHLRSVRRQEVAERIQKAKEIGGTVDNAEYDEAKNEQAFIEGRIATLDNMLKTAVIIPSHEAPPEAVDVGSLVTVLNPQGKQEHFDIVGSTEADPISGKISNESPVGQALLGHRIGDEVEVSTPAGVFKLTIVEIR